MKTLHLGLERDIWFTSDLHLGHNNIIQYANRPFTSTESMDKTIIDNWNSVVDDKDIVFILGDFTMLGTKSWVYYLSKLKGVKYLIIGNHDKSIPKSMLAEATPLKNIMVGEQRITLCHYPMLSWYQSHRDSWQLFGHVHSGPNTFTMDRISPRQYDVGVDNNNFTPISFNQLKNIIDGKNITMA